MNLPCSSIRLTSESVDSWGRNIFVKKYTEFQYVEHENRAQDMEICASQAEYDVKYPFLCVNFHSIWVSMSHYMKHLTQIEWDVYNVVEGTQETVKKYTNLLVCCRWEVEMDIVESGI